MEIWSDFKKLEAAPRFTPADFRETLDGGQAFTWRALPDFENASNFLCAYEGVFANNAARIFLGKDENVYYSQSKRIGRDISADILFYLDSARDYDAVIKSLPLKKDEHLREGVKAYPTLRILRQAPKDAIISFICSSSKRIVQIKQCVGLLSENLGEEITGGFFSLPDFEKIADADISELRACKLGFRADYLLKTAKKITADNFAHAELGSMPYADAKKYLLTLSGIGEKVADCILLFGAAKFEAFPVDTWIKKAMSDMYGISNPAHIGGFTQKHFGENAGYAQQVIFARIRKM